MSCLRSLLSLVLTLGGIALVVYGFYGIAQGSAGLGSLVEMGPGVVLILLGVVNSASIVKAQREKEINRVVVGNNANWRTVFAAVEEAFFLTMHADRHWSVRKFISFCVT
jgi:hypothetical protein